MPTPKRPVREGERLSARLLNEAIGAQRTTIAGGSGVLANDGDVGATLRLGGDDPARRVQFFARLGLSYGGGSGSTNQWTYDFDEVVKVGAGYSGWFNKIGGRSTSSGWPRAYNLAEAHNNGVGIEGNGIDIDRPDFPDTFLFQPIPQGSIVLMTRVLIPSIARVEAWFDRPNAVDGACPE